MPVHVAITRKVLPGKEAEFTEALRKFLGDSFSHDGVHGAALITALPGSGGREIGILRTFKDDAEKEDFYRSAQFQQWEAYASTVTKEPTYRALSGLEAWFRSPMPPPKWKMAVATFCGVVPTSFLLSYTVGVVAAPLPLPIRIPIIAACMVALLTWVIMPIVTKWMRPWLKPEPAADTP